MSKIPAQSFNASCLRAIANNARHQARLIRELEAKPWRRSQDQNEDLDTFDQLAHYCERVISMQSD